MKLNLKKQRLKFSQNVLEGQKYFGHIKRTKSYNEDLSFFFFFTVEDLKFFDLFFLLEYC